MSAETLRRAAALMRERAEAATEGVWIAFRANKGLHAVYGVTTDLVTDYESDVAVDIKVEDAEHIASWHPAVALAVADCIDAALCYFDPDEFSEAEQEMHDSLLTLARTYLNESA